MAEWLWSSISVYKPNVADINFRRDVNYEFPETYLKLWFPRNIDSHGTAESDDKTLRTTSKVLLLNKPIICILSDILYICGFNILL